MTHPIPDNALDDRLGIVGTAGAGKTYAAGGAVERLLARRGRAIIPDPMGVWYGLRLMADGRTPSPYNVVIFGGRHGDLPITEHAGALIGETVAGMAESAIIDLSGFGTKASERRFMFAFLTALYRHANSAPVHLIFDEADMWAPERMLDKEGEAAKLLGMMETVVRRGRIKGFIPWLISQRPAVLSKNVLSQVDGLIAMKLTSSQDRDALGAWVEGQADKDEWKRIRADLAALQRGQGVVWIPTRDILKTVAFPAKRTFDSSRTPKRGEHAHQAKLAPLDLPKLRERMATVEAETKANDPRALRAEIARLKALAACAPKPSEINPIALERAETRGYREGKTDGYRVAIEQIESLIRVARAVDSGVHALVKGLEKAAAWKAPKVLQSTFKSVVAPVAQSVEHRASNARVAGSSPAGRSNGPGEPMPGPQRKLLTVLAQYPAGRAKKQLAILSGYSHRGGAFGNPLSNLRARGWAEGGADRITITDDGLKALGQWEPLPMGAALRENWFANLDGPPAKLLRALCEVYPKAMSKEELAAACGYQPTGGAFGNPLSRLRALELAHGRGEIRASDDLFE